MPAIPSSPRVKLRTTSRRVPRTRTVPAVADESPEPTMRLSRAIIVMLLLHVVAVGGFLASSVLKDRDRKHSSPDASGALEAEDSQVPAKNDSSSGRKMPIMGNSHPGVHVVRPGETLTLIANENGVTLEALVAANGAETVTNGLKTGQELKLPSWSPDPTSAPTDSTTSALNQIDGHSKSGVAPATGETFLSAKVRNTGTESGKLYVVAKGESVYTIAEKNKVSSESLLKLNQIDDPKKIRPGQKLRLPPVQVKPKTKQS